MEKRYKTLQTKGENGKKAEKKAGPRAATVRLRQEFVAWNSWLSKRNASAESIVVLYFATLAKYSVHRHGDDSVFVFGEPAADPAKPEEWKGKEPTEANVWERGKELDPYQVRADFEEVSDLEGAHKFLDRTGAFLPGAEDFTWREFQTWQRFAKLVRERKEIEQSTNEQTGAAAEARRALGGAHDSAFFSADILQPPGAISTEMLADRQRRSDQHKALYRWFVDPPGQRKFVPRSADPALFHEMLRSGARAEFLRPRDQLQQVFLIEPTVTIEAIAASIYADWITGVDCKKCPVCREIFEVKNRAWQEYCSAKCKGTARMKRYRDPNKPKTRPRQAPIIPSRASKGDGPGNTSKVRGKQ